MQIFAGVREIWGVKNSTPLNPNIDGNESKVDENAQQLATPGESKSINNAIARICHGNSVCPSVCLSHGWISQKRLKLGSCNFHHTVAPRNQQQAVYC